MADSLLLNTIEKLIGKLGSMAVESWNMRDDLEKLVEKMSEIKAVVLDAEEQQNNNHQVQLWLEKLKDVLEDAEDLLDDFNTEELRRKVMTNDKKAKKFRIFFSSSNQVLFSFKMVGKIKELGKRIEALNVDKRIFNFTSRTPEQRVLKQRETRPFIGEEEVIGREREKTELLEWLFDTSMNVKENVSVISIIGVGGLGKTTLAQHVYNDNEVQQHFEFKKWVCVSDEFNVRDIASKIIGSNTVEMDEVQLELGKKVERKRYLLVLDDIWNEDRDTWVQLMTLLKDGAKGSKIIVTTRIKKVAEISGSSSILSLEGLDKKQSWRLFCRLAFKNEKELENENLVLIGKEIVKKCSGVPLAIRCIGCLMYSMEAEEDWLTFKDKDLLKIDEKGNNKIFQLVKLSYDRLPIHLKKCFAFCSLFPKDFLIEKQMLIRLWIAQGFVQSSDENMCLEDIGEKYFMDFVHKSLFQIINKQIDGKVRFQMHDIVHDLASVISRSDYLLVSEKGQHIDKHIQHIRHVSICFKLDSFGQVPTSLLNAYKLRTFLLPRNKFLDYSRDMSACNSILSCSKQLRVMNLHYILKIPSCIGRMKHLRYLDLSFSRGIQKLPRSITGLINLETLLLNDCENLRELPKDFWKLVSLRHLEFYRCYALTCMPRGIGKMTNLQTLTPFLLNTTSKDSAKASELRQLKYLRGKLEIEGMEWLRHCPTEAKHINLMGKPHLHQLTLNWYSQIVDDLEKDDVILQDIVMQSYIKVLEINGFRGMKMSSLVNLSTNFDELSLSICTRLQHLELAPLHVKRIKMYKLISLEWIINDNNNGDNSSAFCASLTEIDLTRLDNLKGWCRCTEEKGCPHQFKSLESLWIERCPNLISIPQHKDIKKIHVMYVTAEILLQAVTHSKVEFLEVICISNLKSIRGVFQHLTRVCKLEICQCPEFDPCNDEDGCYSMKWKELTNLKELIFSGIPKMKYLPEGLQHITSLQTLKITRCENLTSIPEWATSKIAQR